MTKMREKFDVIIIGGGPAGYQAAVSAANKNMRVLILEEKHLGGVCLNEGCIPTKTLLNSSKLFNMTKNLEVYGINVSNLEFSLDKVVDRKNSIVNKLRYGISQRINVDNISFMEQHAEIMGKDKGYQIRLGNGNIVSGEYLIIASGSRALFPKIDGLEDALDSGFAINSKEFLDSRVKYHKVVIIGCGVIGIEFASFLLDIGCAVTIIENRYNIFPDMDEDVRRLIIRSLQGRGATVELGCKVQKISDDGFIEIQNSLGDKKVINCDKVLLCTGRKPNIDDLGLENVGVCIRNGAIKTASNCMTNCPNVFAIGDVNGKTMLAHCAYKEARVAIDNICGVNNQIDYCMIPKVIYSNPEIAWVGLSEEECKNKGIISNSKSCSMKYSSKFMVENEYEQGLCKVIFDNETGQIKGCFIVGNGASEIITIMEIMMCQNKTIEDVKNVVFPHPSICEIFKEICEK